MATSVSSPAEGAIGYAGWRVVLAAHFGVMFSFGSLLVFTFSVFLKPLTAEFGWSREQVSGAFGIAAMTVALASPMLGRLLDRWPPRPIVLVCFLVFGCAFASLSLLTPHLWHLYATFVVLGLVGNGTTQMGFSGAVSSWFTRRRGMALAVVMAGTGIGSMVLPPLAQALISGVGWRGAYLILGGMVLLAGLPLTALFLRRQSREGAVGVLPSASVGFALRTRIFWILVATLFLSSIAANGAITHLAALLTDRGITPAQAALVASALGGASFVGRLITGALLDRFFGPRVAFLLLASMAGGILLLARAETLAAGMMASILIGVGLGGEADVTPYLLARYFGLGSFSTLYGLTWTFYAVAGGIGPVVLGRMFDLTASYTNILTLLSIPTLFSAILMPVDATLRTGRGMTSPTGRLLAGVLFTLLIIVGYAGYTLNSVRRMRQVQSDTIDLNRKAALQLIRIQGDLNGLALAMRDMLDNLDGYPLTAWSGQLERMHGNLDDAIRIESELVGARRDAQQTAYLLSSFAQFWTAVDQVRKLADTGDEKQARELVRQTLLPRQEALSALTARLLVQNNEAEQRAAEVVLGIFAGIERNAYWFLALSVVLVLAGGVTMIRSNRALFDRVTELSDQRRELAQQLIATQESTLRSISRDLHDEFGQILTAVGAMLKRAGRLAPSEFHEQIRETGVVVQETLEKIRALSQSLQPVILEEQGLAAAVQWHLSVFQRQTGIAVRYDPPVEFPEIPSATSIHVFRILQEALNNAARHAKVSEVTVELGAGHLALWLHVTDKGIGIPPSFKPGIGLAGMRERAALIDGVLDIDSVEPTGTKVVLSVLLRREKNG